MVDTQAYFFTGTPEGMESAINNMKAEFMRILPFKQSLSEDLAPQDGVYSTQEISLTTDQAEQLRNAQGWILLLSHSSWTSQGISDHADYCKLMQTPESLNLTPDDVFWHPC